jgi:hypothetical protein
VALDPGYEPAALPNLARAAVKPVFRCLDRLVVVVRVYPFTGRDLIDPIEAIKPVSCQLFEPEFLLPQVRRFVFATLIRRFGFIKECKSAAGQNPADRVKALPSRVNA